MNCDRMHCKIDLCGILDKKYLNVITEVNLPVPLKLDPKQIPIKLPSGAEAFHFPYYYALLIK